MLILQIIYYIFLNDQQFVFYKHIDFLSFNTKMPHVLLK